MRNYEVGAFLKQARRQKGISQKQLSDSTGITEVAISRIETGQGTPRKANVDMLLQKLGYDPMNLGIYLLSRKEIEWQTIVDKIEAFLSFKKILEAEILVESLEKYKGFAKNDLNRQFLILTKARILRFKGDSENKVFAMLEEAIKISKITAIVCDSVSQNR